MQKAQTVEFAVVKDAEKISRIGRTSILQPKINFKGGSIKWYADKPKQAGK